MMKEKTYILFDVDGTLTDPKEGITKSVQYALRRYGIEVEDLDSLTPFIGPPLRDSYERFYGFTPEQSREAVLVYREYFTEKGWLENRVYPGIREMLAALREAGAALCVATSKPEVFAKQILDYFGLTEYFDFIGGADLEETRVRKADVIRYVLENCGLGQEDVKQGRIFMVGDREHDVLGARESGIPCVGVLYGYGSREEMENCRAEEVAATVEELQAVLLKRVATSHNQNL